MVKILTFLILLLASLVSKVIMPAVPTYSKKEKTEIRQIFDNNSIHNPFFDFRKKKSDDE